MSTPSKTDPFGFRFWLGWIIKFAGTLTAFAVFWTVALTMLLGPIRSKEMVLTWSCAVFGCWFITVIPFMRKKERIWKRLNQDQEKSADAWLAGMNMIIGFLLVSLIVWSWILRDKVLTLRPGFEWVWIKAVFGSWLLAVMPVLVWMYRKADAIFKDAQKRQTAEGPKFQSKFIERSKRLLPQFLIEKLKSVEETLPRGHVVDLILKDGRRIPHVFILDGREILGVYNLSAMDFNAEDAADVETIREINEFAYEESKWLRLDSRV